MEDLRSVVEYFTGVKRETVAVLGHSKGMPQLNIISHELMYTWVGSCYKHKKRIFPIICYFLIRQSD